MQVALSMAPRTRVLLAETDPVVRGWLAPALERALGVAPDVVEHVQGLERGVLEDEFHLVISNARLAEDSTLTSLARVRSAGSATPFIVYTSFNDSLMRVLISDSEGTVLSSRVIDLDNLVDLARSLSERTKLRTNA